jgi:hypothetical protein
MTKHHGITQENGGTIPVACTLSRAGLTAQASRWARLAARALTERTETAQGLRLSFRPEPGAGDELRQLVAVEKACCAWADWTVDTRAGRIILDVHATGDGVDALHTMFTGLHPAQTGPLPAGPGR